jgi:hypothetical protein
MNVMISLSISLVITTNAAQESEEGDEERERLVMIRKPERGRVTNPNVIHSIAGGGGK